MKFIKNNLPNFLTILRILLIPLIIFMYINNNLLETFIIALSSALTDAFDGYLSRKWKTTSELGKILDVIADKLLATGLIISLAFTYNFLIINFALEIIIVIISVISFYLNKDPKTNYIGKIKTVALFVTLINGFAIRVNILFEPFLFPLFISTIILQLYTIYSYGIKLIKKTVKH